MKTLILCSMVIGWCSAQLGALSGLAGGAAGGAGLPGGLGQLIELPNMLKSLKMDPVPPTNCPKELDAKDMTYDLTMIAPYALQTSYEFQQLRLAMVTYSLDCKENNTQFEDYQKQKYVKSLAALTQMLVADPQVPIAEMIEPLKPTEKEKCGNKLAKQCANLLQQICGWTKAKNIAPTQQYLKGLSKATNAIADIKAQREACIAQSDNFFQLENLDDLIGGVTGGGGGGLGGGLGALGALGGGLGKK